MPGDVPVRLATDTPRRRSTWRPQFVAKYLEEAVQRRGAAPSRPSPAAARARRPAGRVRARRPTAPDRPFASSPSSSHRDLHGPDVTRDRAPAPRPPTRGDHAASSRWRRWDGDATPIVTRRLRPAGSRHHRGRPDTAALDPVTAWPAPRSSSAPTRSVRGEVQDLANPKVPTGDVVEAPSGRARRAGRDRRHPPGRDPAPGDPVPPGRDRCPAGQSPAAEHRGRRRRPQVACASSAPRHPRRRRDADEDARLSDSEVASVPLARRGGRAALVGAAGRPDWPPRSRSVRSARDSLPGDAASVTGVTPDPSRAGPA